jgi:opacity protein-like surface antigen
MPRYLLALLVLLTPCASWGAEDSMSGWGNDMRGWYLGGGYALSNVFWTEADSSFGSSVRGSNDSGFIINGGYRLNRFLAVELGYLDGGEPTFRGEILNDTDGFNVIDINAVQKTDAIELSGIVVFPFAKIWEIYMKLGAAYWDATSTQTLTPPSGPPIDRVIDESGTDFLLGIGAGITPWENVHVRLEVQAFRTDDKLLGLDFETVDDLEARFDAYTLEVHWRFP